MAIRWFTNGGKSYYSLDLSDVTSSSGTPKLKFKIIPSGACSSSNPLGCMGQVGQNQLSHGLTGKVNIKLVMLVGGVMMNVMNQCELQSLRY